MSSYARQPFSVTGKFAFVYMATVTLVAVAAAWISTLTNDPLVIFLAALGLGFGPGLFVLHRLNRSTHQVLKALFDGLHSFKEQDYNLRLAVKRNDELGSIAALFNNLGESLREEHNNAYQKGLLLETVLQRNPNAVIITTEADRVLFANQAARQLLNEGGKIEGYRFGELLEDAPDALSEVLSGALEDALLTLTVYEETETFHVSRRAFNLNSQNHTLTQIAPLTRELNRQEARIWKKTIRVIAHELNNSIAPISSLLHSARLILNNPKHAHRLESIFDTIDGRAEHLRVFIDGYAHYARLPEPRCKETEWKELVDNLQGLTSFNTQGNLPAYPGYFDPGQMEQMLINLLKNAKEAGGDTDKVSLQIDAMPDGATSIRVMDRGDGMSDEAMRKALLPFYSTKQEGTGLGLPLCREIAEGHRGKLRIERREGGGTIVTCDLPPTQAL